MNTAQSPLQHMEDTKRALIQAVRHYTQKRIRAEDTAMRLLEARRLRPVPTEVELLEEDEDNERKALNAMVDASESATQAGWSSSDVIRFIGLTEQQMMAADAAGRGGGEQGGGRRKVRKTRATRMRSKRRKFATRKQKHKHRA
jgi:hypothetical protein